MNRRNFALLKTMLRSSSLLNKIRFATDKKSRGNAIGNLVGKTVIYIFLVFYSVLLCVGYGQMGVKNVIPAACAIMIAAISFLFTVIKTNGYLFHFKEYDMLMSLPYKPETIAACKFLYMYVQSLPWYLSISWPMMLGYGIYTGATFSVYFTWAVLTFVLPIIPMLIAAFIGFLIAKISSNFKKTNMVQTIIMFGIVIFAFGLRFAIEAVFKNNEIEMVLENAADMIQDSLKYYPPAQWFVDSVVNFEWNNFLMLIVSTGFVFWLVFLPVGKSYRKINSAFQNHAQTKKCNKRAIRKSNVVVSVAYKEWRRFLGSSNYMVNCAVGEVLAVILGIAVLVVGFDKCIAIITKGAPLDSKMLVPAIPLMVYFLIGMISTTTCSPSLEGKNYWIVQSLPISKRTLYHGKMLFNMWLTVPVGLFTTFCLCISAKVPFVTVLLCFVETIVLCAFSTAWGLVCGLRFIKLDWENELEVIKQGVGVIVYLLPNMFVVLGMVVLVVVLGNVISVNLISLAVIGVGLLLTVICYLRAMKLG